MDEDTGRGIGNWESVVCGSWERDSRRRVWCINKRVKPAAGAWDWGIVCASAAWEWGVNNKNRNICLLLSRVRHLVRWNPADLCHRRCCTAIHS